MKILITNLPQVRAELRECLKTGMKKFELLLFRMHDGRGKILPLKDFCLQYIESYPDLVAELRDRLENEITEEREMLYVEAKKNGKWECGVLDQPKYKVYSIGRHTSNLN